MIELNSMLSKELSNELTKILGTPEWKLEADYELDYLESGEDARVYFCLKVGEEEVSDWSMSTLPGCCGVCVSMGAFVFLQFRKKGIGTLLNKVRIHLAKKFGYGMLIATNISTNEPQNKIFFNNNWECLREFTNPRTGNDIFLQAYPLSEC